MFDRLLAFTNLDPFTEPLAGKLSGGMKQKLGLACALLGHPRLLLLDEPGVGVDPISRRELWKMVGELTGQGLAVVWSTAYLEEAELCGDSARAERREITARRQTGGPHRPRPRPLLSDAKRRGPPARGRWPMPAKSGRDRWRIAGTRRAGGVARTRQAVWPRRICRRGAAAKLGPVKPRFEDAFINDLGGVPHTESALAERFHRIGNGHDVVIEAKDLTRKFGDFTATDRATFTVQRGEIFGLLGPNGAGKSTTFQHDVRSAGADVGHGSRDGAGLAEEREPGPPAARLHGPEVFPLRQPHRPAEPQFFRGSVWAARARAGRRGGGDDRRVSFSIGRAGGGRDIAARTQAASRAGLRGHARTGHSLPRRTDLRRRSGHAPRILEPHQRPG